MTRVFIFTACAQIKVKRSSLLVKAFVLDHVFKLSGRTELPNRLLALV